MSLLSMIKRKSAAPRPQAQPWWKGAAIYQIYPRSFMDSDGDGIGDLPGITAKLDHVASLGVDAIWISPFFTSPMQDFGYDVADFRDVDPVFGTLADFDALIEKAHALGLKVIIDQVYSHSSDKHRWFEASRQDRTNAHANYYVWADAKPDGTPPNNWQSIFGGPAWTWDPRRKQYYFHNFLPEQPDLNLHDATVQEELLDVSKFWLERGVDGFRLDAVLHMMHDPALTDNPPAPGGLEGKSRSHHFQDNIHNQGHPATFDFLEKLRALTDRYGAVFTVAEVGGTAGKDFAAACVEGDHRLNSAYGFDFLYAEDLSPDVICDTQASWRDDGHAGWPTWAFENHDAPRAVSRWNDRGNREAFARFKMALLAALRGNIILYQGEELGLGQVEIPYEQVRDPEALRNWPLTLSRDGARTPMPWDEAQCCAGFSKVEPWLPVGEDNAPRAVASQEADPGSMLHFTRTMLKLRGAHPALRHGSVTCEVKDNVLSMTRSADGETLTWLFNFNDETVATALTGARTELARVNGGSADALPPLGAVLLGE